MAITSLALRAPLLVALAMAAQPALTAPARSEPSPPPAAATETGDDAAGMTAFLDRLMQAESGGNDLAANRLSTALGPFQFVEATFLEVVARHFAAETAGLTPAQILMKRTDRAFARRAAEAYTRGNAGHLAAAGLKPTYAHLRLAYLVGPSAAVRVIRMPPQTPAALVLGPAAIRANPFLARYTTADLVARAARDVGVTPTATAGITPPPPEPGKPGTGKSARPARVVTPACNLAQAACRRWLALAERRVTRGQRVDAR